VNLYGSTETQRAVAFHEAVPAELEAAAGGGRAREVLPLGRGMRGAQLLVLDPAGRVAGVGEVGEIAVRSPHLALGYLEDDARTAERFVRNPSGCAPEDRLYRTGDLGRYRGDGEVLFLGRADDQVKIRGFRIELGEVVAHLGRAPEVREAAVLPRSDGPLGRRLVAYVVPEPESPPGADALRRHLRRRLPAYMVPATFVFLDTLPLTPNRKLDRRALLAVDDRGREEAGPRGEGPDTEAEHAIAAIVREVLGRERVGVEENFFDLGGNSLLLVQVHARLEEAFGVEIAVVELFNHPTVRALARFLGDRHASGRAPGQAPGVSPGAAPGPIPGEGRDAAAERAPNHRTEQVLRGKDRLKRRRRRQAE
jgi:acyl carrier protein